MGFCKESIDLQMIKLTFLTMLAKILLPLYLFALLISCSEKKTNREQDQEIPRILNKEILVRNDNCLPDSINCTYIKIDYPEFSDTTNVGLNEVIHQKLNEAVSSYFSEEAIGGSYEYMANLFIRDYNSFKIDFPDYGIGWYVRVFSEITYESQKILSFRIDAESFTGGAHPNSSSVFYVIDKWTNNTLSAPEIISDTTKFKRILEAAFRKQKGIDEGQSFADKGFYLEEGEFLLSNNIGITEEHVIVHFNPYEIAPYALGATTLELNKSELESMLKLD